MSSRRPVIPHTAGAGPTTRVKSTLIASSRAGLIERGHQAAYDRALGVEGAAAMRNTVMATQWLPMEVALRHYRAADAVGLSVAEMHAIGNVVGARIEGVLMGSLARVARFGGITPWTPLSRFDQLWGRMYEGGSLAVYELGPKDARIEIVENELADVTYWRVALTGLIQGATEMFAKTAHTSLRDAQRRPRSVIYEISWV